MSSPAQFIDSDTLGTGAFTTRIYFRVEAGELHIWWLDQGVERPLTFFELSPDDGMAILDAAGFERGSLERGRIVQTALSELRREMKARGA